MLENTETTDCPQQRLDKILCSTDNGTELPSDAPTEGTSLDLPSITVDTELAAQSSGQRSRLIRGRGRRWLVGATIRVGFLEGPPKLQNIVKKHAAIWEKHANISFHFARKPPYEIRISFDEKDSSWSLVGTEALEETNPRKATMNLAISLKTTAVDIQAHVLHEFGHALGCLHEHSSPNAKIKWHTEAVYQHYWSNGGWNRAEVEQQVLYTYEERDIRQLSEDLFDPLSIMAYEIPAELRLDGRSIPFNVVLSEQDKRSIAKAYLSAKAMGKKVAVSSSPTKRQQQRRAKSSNGSVSDGKSRKRRGSSRELKKEDFRDGSLQV